MLLVVQVPSSDVHPTLSECSCGLAIRRSCQTTNGEFPAGCQEMVDCNIS
jgi:hypothetical protein